MNLNYRIKINDEEYTNNLVLPFSIQKTLDESLDVAFIKLAYLNKADAFKPLDKVEIETTYGIEKRTFYFFVSSDVVTEIISLKSYNHEIALVEQTKWLERFTGITKTNTKALINDYSKAQKFVQFYREKIGGITEIDATSELVNIKSPYLKKNIDFYVSSQLGIPRPHNLELKQMQLWYNGERKLTKDLTMQVEHIVFPAENGNWEMRFFADDGVAAEEYFFQFSAIPDYQPPELLNFTITDVINNLLETVECLGEREEPRFKLNEEQALEFSSIEAPDFSLNGTLWECLSEVGKFIHAIPRLENGVISFEKLGGTSKTNEVRLANYCSNTKKFDIEQYATHIDSIVDNIVNTDEKQQGSIVAPFRNGFKTVRTDTGKVVLTNENVFIETREPIEEIVKVECGYLSDNRLVGDITPYIFESAEYNALSEFDVGYPLSRNFALEYTQGQKNIRGLGFKSPNAISPIFTETSIINIIARKLNVSSASIASEKIQDLQFKVTYIPIVSARLKQSKGNLQDLQGRASTLDFNQSANKINSVAYGENMKGTIARLGNPEISKLYLFANLNFIPKVGELFNDDYYISVVKTEFYPEFYKCEIALSKDFNKLNEYVGIKSQKRFYEISEKQAVDRYVNYEDYCIIGESSIKHGSSLIWSNGLYAFGDQFVDKTLLKGEVDSVDFGEREPLTKVQSVSLPVTTLGIGNSIVFNFHFDDNYSAGNTRIVKGATNLQYQTRYTDIYGRLGKVSIHFGVSKKDEMPNYETAVREGNLLPKSSRNLTTTPYFSTLKVESIKLLKDSRENINFTYQLHFVAQDSSYVIGSALTRRSTFVTNDVPTFKIYTLPERLNKFDKKVDLTNATLVVDTINDLEVYPNTNEDYVKFGGFTAINDGKAWALVTEDGELALGRNIEIKSGDKINSTFFTFSHTIK